MRLFQQPLQPLRVTAARRHEFFSSLSAVLEMLHCLAGGFVSDELGPSEVEKKRDRALGMGARITRRDFLNGVALTVGASLVPGIIPPERWAAAAAGHEEQDVPGH